MTRDVKLLFVRLYATQVSRITHPRAPGSPKKVPSRRLMLGKLGSADSNRCLVQRLPRQGSEEKSEHVQLHMIRYV